MRQTLHLRLWGQTKAMTRSVYDHRFTVIEAGHGVGKSYTLAGLVCWWMSTHNPAIAITLAPTWSQVRGILWRHIRSMHQKHFLLGEVLESPNWRIDADRFAIGLSPRKNTQTDVQALQGFHGPNLLVVMDEAALLPPVFWEAATSLVTGEEDRMIALGQPLDQSGPFWRACHASHWHHLSISCFDHPNVRAGENLYAGAVTRTWIEERISDGWAMPCGPEIPGAFEIPYAPGRFVLPDPIFFSRVLGIAPEEAEDQLIKMAGIMAAQAVWMDMKPSEDEPIVLGLDPARFGAAKSALCCRHGKKVLWIRYRSQRDSLQLAAWVRETVEETHAKDVFIDSIGIGAGVVDQARVDAATHGFVVHAINFAEAATQTDRYANKRAECWWRVREAIRNEELGLPPDHILEKDLQIVKYTVRRKVEIEGKDEIMKRLGRSPDAGDALALTYALPMLGNSPPIDTTPAQSRWIVDEIPAEDSRWRRFEHGERPFGR